jgi:hypothetical protein
VPSTKKSRGTWALFGGPFLRTALPFRRLWPDCRHRQRLERAELPLFRRVGVPREQSGSFHPGIAQPEARTIALTTFSAMSLSTRFTLAVWSAPAFGIVALVFGRPMLALAGVIALATVQTIYLAWLCCPRCRESLFLSGVTRLFARQCSRCGLDLTKTV